MGLGVGSRGGGGRGERIIRFQEFSPILAWVASPRNEGTTYKKWGFAPKEGSQTQGG